MKSVQELPVFKLQEDAIYAVDTRGVAILYKKTNEHVFLTYPEAAVWCVLVEGNADKRSKQMLQAILGKPETKTDLYIHQCMEKWRQLNFIQ
jgi:hypothetical protein